MQQNKVKAVVRRCAYVAILAFNIISTRAYDLAAVQAENFVKIPGAPYVLWLFNLFFVSATDFLQEDPGWALTRCWLRRMVYATAIFFLSVALYLLYILAFIRSDAEMSVSPGS